MRGEARYDNSLHDWSQLLREQEADRRRHRRIRRLIAVIVAAAVAGAVAVVGWVVVPSIWYNHTVYNKTYLLGKYESRLSAPARAELFAALPGLQRFVEQQRHGHFLHPVTMRFLPDDIFFDVWGTPENIDTTDAVALGFATSTADVRQQLSQLQNPDVPGFFDAKAHVLYIRGQDFDDYAMVSLVNMLTQAYDDQHFNVQRLLERHGDAYDAASALVIGDAVQVQNAYAERLPVGERCLQLNDSLQPFDAACRAAGYTSAHQTQTLSHWGLEAETNFPAVMGSRYVRALIASGGQGAVDRAFRDPPTTTAEVIDLTRTAPPTTHALGALQLSALVTNGLLGTDATPYLHGWRSDTAVTGQCLRDDISFVSTSAASTAYARFSAWAKAKPGSGRSAERTGPDGVRISLCAVR